MMKDEIMEGVDMAILLQFVLLVVGFIMLVKGADWFVEGASGIADRFGIPQLVIGLTIVAMGTSAPEAAISIASALKGSAGITVGNVIGSNIMNVLLILGITALIVPLQVQMSTFRAEIPFVAAITVLLLALGMNGDSLSRLDGGILLALLVLFLFYLLQMAKKGKGQEEAQPEKKKKVWQLLLLTVVGGVLIVWGSNVTVDSASAIAKFFGMSDRMIGLTIVAFGTSLPELITSVTAGIRGKADLAIGNIIGSNIFNILFVGGMAAVITPVAFETNFIVDTVVAAAAVVLLWLLVCNRDKKLKRPGGIVMLASYAAYFVYLICL